MSKSKSKPKTHPFGADVGAAYTNTAYPVGNATSSSRYDRVLKGFENSTNPAILVIDSDDRNREIDEEPNKYTIKLEKQYKDVVSIELVFADVPNSGYVVQSSHNQFHFQETTTQESDGTYLTAEINEGNFPIDDTTGGESVRGNLETALNAAGENGYTYTVSLNEYTNKITIAQDNGGDPSAVFNLLFLGKSQNDRFNKMRKLYKDRTIAPMIGFKRANYTGDTSYTAPMAYNLKVNKFISLFARAAEDLDRVDSTNSKVSGALCILPFDSSLNNFQHSKNCDSVDNDRYIKYFTEPVPSINEIDIEFRDMYGELFEFNGHNHVLIFEVMSQTRGSIFKMRE